MRCDKCGYPIMRTDGICTSTICRDPEKIREQIATDGSMTMKDLWDEIYRLKSQLAKAECKETGLGFYANSGKWDGGNINWNSRDGKCIHDRICDSDLSVVGELLISSSDYTPTQVGGKHAREYFQNKESK